MQAKNKHLEDDKKQRENFETMNYSINDIIHHLQRYQKLVYQFPHLDENDTHKWIVKCYNRLIELINIQFDLIKMSPTYSQQYKSSSEESSEEESGEISDDEEIDIKNSINPNQQQIKVRPKNPIIFLKKKKKLEVIQEASEKSSVTDELEYFYQDKIKWIKGLKKPDDIIQDPFMIYQPKEKYILGDNYKEPEIYGYDPIKTQGLWCYYINIDIDDRIPNKYKFSFKSKFTQKLSDYKEYKNRFMDSDEEYKITINDEIKIYRDIFKDFIHKYGRPSYLGMPKCMWDFNPEYIYYIRITSNEIDTLDVSYIQNKKLTDLQEQKIVCELNILATRNLYSIKGKKELINRIRQHIKDIYEDKNNDYQNNSMQINYMDEQII